MTTERLFDVTFLLAAPFWALMLLAPGWSWTRRILANPWSVTPPLAVYLATAVPDLGTLWSVVSAPDLDALRQFAGSAAGATAVWAHLIAFDLFVGRWIFRDARARGVPHAVVTPMLVLTILLSPLGLLGWLAVRSVHDRVRTPRLPDREREQRHATP